MASGLEFLTVDNKVKKIIRTSLYGDLSFSYFEIQIVHTPVFQRLYELHQLGFTDRVYADAVHSRFNHSLGVPIFAQRILENILAWLDGPSKKDDFMFTDEGGAAKSYSPKKLASHIRKRVNVVRLIALLHDIGHAAYGHTLEDEISVFQQKHDDWSRQKIFFDALTAQLICLWSWENKSSGPSQETLVNLACLKVKGKATCADAQFLYAGLCPAQRKRLIEHLQDLELAFLSLLHLDFSHQTRDSKKERPHLASSRLLVREVLDAFGEDIPVPDFDFHRDLFLIDIVGNTICADLTDYARRDAQYCGLSLSFETRFLKYAVVVSVKGELSPTKKQALRLAIQFCTNKMRHDVITDMSLLLKARYIISERVLFHPTKCAAGAMLGKAIMLLGLARIIHEATK